MHPSPGLASALGTGSQEDSVSPHVGNSFCPRQHVLDDLGLKNFVKGVSAVLCLSAPAVQSPKLTAEAPCTPA